MVTVFVILSLTAFVCAIANAAKPERVPLWIAVIVLCLIELLRAFPLGR